MDDEIRENLQISHPIGTIISYEHSGLTDSGKPRFARYIRKRDDIVIKDMPVEKKASVEREIILSRPLVSCISMRTVHLRVVLMEMQLIH